MNNKPERFPLAVTARVVEVLLACLRVGVPHGRIIEGEECAAFICLGAHPMSNVEIFADGTMFAAQHHHSGAVDVWEFQMDEIERVVLRLAGGPLAVGAVDPIADIRERGPRA